MGKLLVLILVWVVFYIVWKAMARWATPLGLHHRH
jgi:hypothetical protein